MGLADYNALSGHPTVGASWESFVIANLLATAPERTLASFYRTAVGAEIDLLLEIPGNELWAIDIKRGLSPKLEKGFLIACDDLQPKRQFVVYVGNDRYRVKADVEVIGLRAMMEMLATL